MLFVFRNLTKQALNCLAKNCTIYIIYRTIGLSNCTISPENFAYFAFFNCTLSEGLVIAQWHKSSDRRNISQLKRSNNNYEVSKKYVWSSSFQEGIGHGACGVDQSTSENPWVQEKAFLKKIYSMLFAIFQKRERARTTAVQFVWRSAAGWFRAMMEAGYHILLKLLSNFLSVSNTVSLSRAHFCNCLLITVVFLIPVIKFSATMQITVCHYAISFINLF